MRFIKLCSIILSAIIMFWIFNYTSKIYLNDNNWNFFANISRILVYFYSLVSSLTIIMPSFRRTKKFFLHIIFAILIFVLLVVFRFIYVLLLLITS